MLLANEWAMSALFIPINYVVCLGSGEEMPWIAAFRIIASMTNDQLIL